MSGKEATCFFYVASLIELAAWVVGLVARDKRHSIFKNHYRLWPNKWEERGFVCGRSKIHHEYEEKQHSGRSDKIMVAKDLLWRWARVSDPEWNFVNENLERWMRVGLGWWSFSGCHNDLLCGKKLLEGRMHRIEELASGSFHMAVRQDDAAPISRSD